MLPEWIIWVGDGQPKVLILATLLLVDARTVLDAADLRPCVDPLVLLPVVVSLLDASFALGDVGVRSWLSSVAERGYGKPSRLADCAPTQSQRTAAPLVW